MNSNQTNSGLGWWSNFGYTGHWKWEYGTIGWRVNDINDGFRVPSLSVLIILCCWEVSSWGCINFDTGSITFFCWTVCPSSREDVLFSIRIWHDHLNSRADILDVCFGHMKTNRSIVLTIRSQATWRNLSARASSGIDGTSQHYKNYS
jgi:hypothetical protein